MRTFELSDTQIEKVKQWDNPETGHKCNCFNGVNKHIDVTGARLEYCFIPTGLGDVTIVRCACGDELDITEGWG
jgi:hypothetical protein